jgi:hypothetical protein
LITREAIINGLKEKTEMPILVVTARIRGIGRVAENPKELSLYFDSVPTDDDMRRIQEAIKAAFR